jgi:DNA-binding transcriptional LysR family regulator
MCRRPSSEGPSGSDPRGAHVAAPVIGLKAVRNFLTIVEEGQFGRAAAKLGISQSGLSQQIQALERDLETELFVRGRRGISLTPAGEALKRHAPHLLATADDTWAELRRISGTVCGRLRVGVEASASAGTALAALARIGAAYRDVQLCVVDGPTSTLLAGVGAAGLEAALVCCEPAALDARLEAALIDRRPLVAVAPASHRLAGRESVQLADLMDEDWVMFERTTGIRGVIDAALASAGAPPPAARAEVTDIKMLIELVGLGLGVGLVPAGADTSRVGAVAIPIDAPGLTRPLSLAWARERRDNLAVRALVRSVAELAPSEDGNTAATLGAV